MITIFQHIFPSKRGRRRQRSPTITDSILHHGGEAAVSREKFVDLSKREQKAIVAYIENHILFKQVEPDEEN